MGVRGTRDSIPIASNLLNATRECPRNYSLAHNTVLTNFRGIVMVCDWLPIHKWNLFVFWPFFATGDNVHLSGRLNMLLIGQGKILSILWIFGTVRQIIISSVDPRDEPCYYLIVVDIDVAQHSLNCQFGHSCGRSLVHFGSKLLHCSTCICPNAPQQLSFHLCYIIRRLLKCYLLSTGAFCQGVTLHH